MAEPHVHELEPSTQDEPGVYCRGCKRWWCLHAVARLLGAAETIDDPPLAGRESKVTGSGRG